MRLETVQSEPYNAATPLAALSGSPTPNELFYVRSNFALPEIDLGRWRLDVSGLVAEPVSYSLEDLFRWDRVDRLVTMECAGNGRALLNPVPDGTPWGLGAVSNAVFSGIPLAELLERSRPADEVVEWVFTGADRGMVAPQGDVNYQFALPRDLAHEGGPLLALELNGEPLPREHGYPLRLVAPGSYGMRSVKWVTSIEAVDRPFDGHFPLKYRYFGDPLAEEGEPVGRMRVRSLITGPLDGATVGASVTLQGIAWSGYGPIEKVEASLDRQAWLAADLRNLQEPFAPLPWTLDLIGLEKGSHRVRVRATDASGAVQPVEPVWNANGYGNNVVHEIGIEVR